MNRIEKAERAALVVILLVVGAMALAASFTHVRDWTMANSPAGTPEWFGWTNALVSELVPLAAMLAIRIKQRGGKGIGYAVFLLVAAATLSLAAQLAVAKPSITGWVLSSVPALAFMALSKLVLSGKVETKSADVRPAASTVVIAARPTAQADITPSPVRPSCNADEPAIPVQRVRARVATNADKVQKAAARMPDATPAEVAAKAGVSESTARRYMRPPAAALPSPSAAAPAGSVIARP